MQEGGKSDISDPKFQPSSQDFPARAALSKLIMLININPGVVRERAEPQ